MSNVQQGKQAVNPPAMLAEYDDDTLATMSDEFAREAERLGRLARGAHAELLARMLEREATKLDTEHWTGAVKPGPIHHTVDDVKRFRHRLAPHVNAMDIDRAFVYPPGPTFQEANRVLNELYQRGGKVAAIIDEERRSVRGESVLRLERKE